MFKISLAQWSLHRELFDGKIQNLDFPGVTKQLGIEAVEFVNAFFKDKATDRYYLDDLKAACDEAGVEPLLIMVDGEGALGDPDDAKRQQTVVNHHQWVTAAWYLGCHSIRVNAESEGGRAAQRDLCVDGLTKLSTFAAPYGINIIVENHGGLSSDGGWLAEVIAKVDLPNCGTLPDFGNFKITKEPLNEYDKYQGVEELMPYAKGISAKSYGFDAAGHETTIDYFKMLDIVVKQHGYRGYVGVEWEGDAPGEREGITLTKQLLEKYRDSLA